MSISPKFLLIDGSCLLSTVYYACIPKELLREQDEQKKEIYYNRLLKTLDGRYINALGAAMSMFLNILSRVHPEFVAIAFDDGRDTFRRDKYPDYKANRGEHPAPLIEQTIYFKQILKDLGFMVFSDPKFEGDDLIASLIHKYDTGHLDFIIYSKDHDFMQLLNDQVFLLRPVTNKRYQELVSKYGILSNILSGPWPNHYLYDGNIVKQYAGVEPSEIIDIYAIIGDQGDNIPGCYRVSSPAFGLIRKYHSIEALYQAIEDSNDHTALAASWKAEGICRFNPIKNLLKYQSDVYLSKFLLTMDKNAITEPLSLSCFYFDGIEPDELGMILYSFEVSGVTVPENLHCVSYL